MWNSLCASFSFATVSFAAVMELPSGEKWFFVSVLLTGIAAVWAYFIRRESHERKDRKDDRKADRQALEALADAIRENTKQLSQSMTRVHERIDDLYLRHNKREEK